MNRLVFNSFFVVKMFVQSILQHYNIESIRVDANDVIMCLYGLKIKGPNLIMTMTMMIAIQTSFQRDLLKHLVVHQCVCIDSKNRTNMYDFIYNNPCFR